MKYKVLIFLNCYSVIAFSSDHTVSQVSINTSSSSQQAVQSSNILALSGLIGDQALLMKKIIDRMEKISEITTKKFKDFDRRIDEIEQRLCIMKSNKEKQ